MSEVILKNKYLDFGGLQKYDELIKALIANGNAELATAIAALDAKIGSLEIEGSDDKTLSESIANIYASISEIIEKQVDLEKNDEELLEQINGIIGDLEALPEGVSSVMTLVEIVNKLKAIDVAVEKNAQDIAGVDTRLTALEETVKNLGEIEGGESLGDIVNKVNTNATAITTLQGAVETLNGEGEGSVKKIANDAANAAAATAESNANAYADSLATNYDAAGTAATLNTAMDERVTKLEAIDHEQLVADAVAAVVAGAESDFDTLKEVADWIAADTLGSAELQITVSEHSETINTINGELDTLEAKVDQDITNLNEHMLEAANALVEVDGRLDALEAFEETHTSIEIAEIEGLFNTQS